MCPRERTDYSVGSNHTANLQRCDFWGEAISGERGVHKMFCLPNEFVVYIACIIVCAFGTIIFNNVVLLVFSGKWPHVQYDYRIEKNTGFYYMCNI